MITVEGALVYGLEFGGVTHRVFTMRAPTIDDGISAIEAAGPGASVLRVRVHKAARQLVRLGGLTASEISEHVDGHALLALPEEDIEPLLAAQDAVEKKRAGSKRTSSHTASSSTPSDPTDTPPPAP